MPKHRFDMDYRRFNLARGLFFAHVFLVSIAIFEFATIQFIVIFFYTYVFAHDAVELLSHFYCLWKLKRIKITVFCLAAFAMQYIFISNFVFHYHSSNE